VIQTPIPAIFFYYFKQFVEKTERLYIKNNKNGKMETYGSNTFIS